VHRDPDPGSRRYRALVTLAADQAFESAAVPGFAFRVAALFVQPAPQLVSKHPRWGWHDSGQQGSESGPMTVVVCAHQYWAVGDETRRFTCSRPTT
jgi:hypothetical protein